jgi:protein-S-isoprenylcysteine O-methyltransferase Ste14
MLSSALVLAAYFAIWATVHSILASMQVKRWAQRTMGGVAIRGYRLAFNILAAVTALPMLALPVLLPDRPLYVVPAPWRWIMHGGQVLATAALGWTLLQTDPWHFAGLAQLFAPEKGRSDKLQVRGFYCHTRHPMYLFSIILIWLTPTMTLNLFVLYLLITLYFNIGSVHEEKRLLAEFGPDYRDYQQRVPRLIPRPGRCYPPSKEDKQ